MGTGIVAIILQTLPYPFPGHHELAIAIFVLNLALFALFLVLSVVRYVLWPAKLWRVLVTPSIAMTLGTVPMGFSSLVTLMALFCPPAWGDKAAIAAWVLWWVDVVLSLAVCLYVPFLITATSTPDIALATMTAQWLLPVVAPIVAAATGAVVAQTLPDPNHALLTCVTCYVLWGIGVPFALLIIGIYYHRLALHKLVPRDQVVSTVIPLGPLGQGGYVMMQLGVVARKVFPELNVLSSAGGEVLYIIGAMVALVLWGFAWLWLWFAVAALVRGRFPFNLGWWAFIFPVGTLPLLSLINALRLLTLKCRRPHHHNQPAWPGVRVCLLQDPRLRKFLCRLCCSSASADPC